MKNLEKYGDILTAKELAEFLKVSTDFIRKNSNNGKIPNIKIGSKYFFSKSKLISYFNGLQI